MKKIIYIILIVIVASCGNSDPRAKLPTTGNFGATVKEDSAKSVSDMIAAIQTKDEMPVKVTGVIDEYCKGEGCWLTLKNQNGESIFVETENKSFILPRNINGKTAVVEGISKKIEKENTGDKEIKIIAKGILIK